MPENNFLNSLQELGNLETISDATEKKKRKRKKLGGGQGEVRMEKKEDILKHDMIS